MPAQSPAARQLASSSLFVLAAFLAQPSFAETADDEGATPTIVVTASGHEQKLAEAPASISVLSRLDLSERRFGSLAEALQNIEGVDVGGEAGKTGGLNISIRGMPSDYTLVLLDGRRQNTPGSVTPNGFGETSTSFLPPFAAIERIEVVRGPMSTLYGSDAMGGVVNIITRKVGDEWVGTLTGESTIQFDDRFGNIASANGFAQGPIVKNLVGLTLRGSYLHRAGSHIEIPGNPALSLGRNPVESHIGTYGGRISLTPHVDHDIWFEYDRSEQRYDNSRGQLGTPGVSGGYTNEQRFNRSNYVLAYTWRAGPGTLDATLSRGDTETIGRTIPRGTPGATAGDPRLLEARNDVADLRFAGVAGPIAYTVGGQYWKARMIDGVAPAPFRFTQWAGFAEATWTIVEAFRLTGGARYDDHSTFGGKWSPRIYGVWLLNDDFTVKGGISSGFKTPRLEQIAEGIVGFGGQGTIPLIGTPGLMPERSTTFEAGVYYESDGFFSGNVTLFHNKFKDKITSGPGIPNCQYAGNPNRPDCLDVGPFPNVDLFGQSINIDEAETRGAEIAGRINFTPSLSFSANYTYTHSEQLSGAQQGKPLIGTPKHMFNGNLRWTISEIASVWLRGEARSSRWRGENAQQAAVGDFRAYEVLHLGGSLQVAPQFRLSATINNLLDTDYAVYVPYKSGANTVYTPAYSINQDGRRLWLSATMDF